MSRKERDRGKDAALGLPANVVRRSAGSGAALATLTGTTATPPKRGSSNSSLTAPSSPGGSKGVGAGSPPSLVLMKSDSLVKIAGAVPPLTPHPSALPVADPSQPLPMPIPPTSTSPSTPPAVPAVSAQPPPTTTATATTTPTPPPAKPSPQLGPQKPVGILRPSGSSSSLLNSRGSMDRLRRGAGSPGVPTTPTAATTAPSSSSSQTSTPAASPITGPTDVTPTPAPPLPRFALPTAMAVTNTNALPSMGGGPDNNKPLQVRSGVTLQRRSTSMSSLSSTSSSTIAPPSSSTTFVPGPAMSSLTTTTTTTTPALGSSPVPTQRSASEPDLTVAQQSLLPRRGTVQWGVVEEFAPMEIDSDVSSLTSGGSRPYSLGDEASEDAEESLAESELMAGLGLTHAGEEDDAWGWGFSDDPNAGPVAGASPLRPGATKTATSTGGGAGGGTSSSTTASSSGTTNATTTASAASSKRSKVPSLLVRMVATRPAPVLGSDSSLDGSSNTSSSANASNASNANAGGNSLLLLGSALWPERRPKPRGGGTTTDADGNVVPSSTSITFLDEQVERAKALRVPLLSSSMTVFMRGLVMGWALRFVPNLLLGQTSRLSWDPTRTGLYLGSSMAAFHVLAMAAANEAAGPSARALMSPTLGVGGTTSSPNASVGSRLNPISCAALLTPFLFVLPSRSRTPITLFVAARAVEAFLNGSVLARMPLEIPVSKYLFALGNAQVVYCWLYHRDALPPELLKFMDATSAFAPSSGDLLGRAFNLGGGAPKEAQGDLVARMEQVIVEGGGLFPSFFRNGFAAFIKSFGGTGLVELMASDVFSAASLFGPVFDTKRGLGVSTVTRSLESVWVLGSDVALSWFGLVVLTRLLNRADARNGWWAGLVSGMVAIELAQSPARRTELALWMLTQAARTVHRIAVARQLIPEANVGINVLVYFASLSVLFRAATESRRGGGRRRTLILGAMFRDVMKRAVLP